MNFSVYLFRVSTHIFLSYTDHLSRQVLTHRWLGPATPLPCPPKYVRLVIRQWMFVPFYTCSWYLTNLSGGWHCLKLLYRYVQEERRMSWSAARWEDHFTAKNIWRCARYTTLYYSRTKECLLLMLSLKGLKEQEFVTSQASGHCLTYLQKNISF